MKISPPPVLSEYFGCVNEGRTDAAAACFASDALFHDEHNDHRGFEAVRTWIEDTTLKYRPQTAVDHIEAGEDAFASTGTVSGTFPGSPVQLHYTFTVRDGKITQLIIQ